MTERVRLDVARAAASAAAACRAATTDDAALERGQLGERRESLRDDVRMRREAVVGQRFPVGKGQHRQLAAEKEPEFRVQPIERPRGLRDEQQRAGGGARRFRERKAAALRRAGPSGSTGRRRSGRGGQNGIGIPAKSQTDGQSQSNTRPARTSRPWGRRAGELTRPPGAVERSAGADHRVDHVVVLEEHAERGIVPARDRRLADGRMFARRAPKRDSTDCIVKPRAGRSTAVSRTAMLSSTERSPPTASGAAQATKAATQRGDFHGAASTGDGGQYSIAISTRTIAYK